MKKYLENLLKAATVWSVCFLTATVLLQIFARFFLAQAPAWTEEVSRLFFIFSIAFAAPLALKSNYYVQLDVFFNMLKPKWQKRVAIFSFLMVILLFAIFSMGALKFVAMGFTENSPSMGIKMGIVFLSMFILGITMCYFLTLKLIKALKHLR